MGRRLGLMAERFIFSIVQSQGRTPAEVALGVRALRPWLGLAGGRGIGWASDEFPVIVAASDAEALADLHQQPHSDLLSMVPTVRPTDINGPRLEGGIVAIRHFEVDEDDVDEFVELSAGAWPTFERLYRTHILGLFRSDAISEGRTALLLTTWYASLAEWERSRDAVVAEEGDAAEAGRRFQRRRQITRRSIVRVGVPL